MGFGGGIDEVGGRVVAVKMVPAFCWLLAAEVVAWSGGRWWCGIVATMVTIWGGGRSSSEKLAGGGGEAPDNYRSMISLCLGYGDLVQGNIMINRVYYIEGINHNLFLVGQFCDADLKVAFKKSTCFVRDVGNKMHKAFPLPSIEFPLAEEVPTASEEGCHCQKKREATARKIALLSKSRRNCQSKSNDSFTKLVPHVTPCILGITIIVTSYTRTPCPIKGFL
uniref:Integrase, catalytic region, zinc finger, CCHC-type, peptidase aspartic, catalytic n=1 Tax=Tanacetum cinerariifolium TaxID=118510 RepID=A0A6L2L259_TANCI|nr:integrase, catalytic region, zinc finger, CCHC-type, peptidase aspartic, catalytic [Tanacetum cinerariifolium]